MTLDKNAPAYKAKMADHAAWQKTIGHILTPLHTPDAKRPVLVASRTFYLLRHADGSESIGQLGVTPEGERKAASDIIRRILTVMMNPEDNATLQRVEAERKQ